MVDFRFYLITDRKTCAPRSLQSVVREACDAGVRAVQLREKDLNEEELAKYTARLLDITKQRKTKLLLNRQRTITSAEDAFISASLGTDGFHFASSVKFPHELRSRFPKLVVGMSTHTTEDAVSAATEGADFITFGPVFDPISKNPHEPPQGLEKLAKVTTVASIPVFAVGGITPENAKDCIEAGAHGVAVVGAVMTAPNVTDVINRFFSAIGSL